MRAISAAIVLLAGVLLFAIGFVAMAVAGPSRFKESVDISVLGGGTLLALLGFVCWLIAFFGTERGQ
jgi:hypothetical protein